MGRESVICKGHLLTSREAPARSSRVPPVLRRGSPAPGPPHASPGMHLLGAEDRGEEHTGGGGPRIRVGAPASRATASCSQPLHRRGPTSPGPPRAAPRLPRAGGRAPRREIGHAGGDTRDFSSRSFGRGGCPTCGRGQGGHRNTGRVQSLSPHPLRRPPREPGPWGTPPPKGGRHTRPPWDWRPAGRPRPSRPGPRAAHLPAARGARTCPPLCSSSGPSSPRDPPRPLAPRAPGAARLTFPARPSPQSPRSRTLRAFPDPQPLPAPAAPPLVHAPLPVGAREPRPRSGSPLPPGSPFGACAPRVAGPHRRRRVSGWTDPVERRAIDPVARQPGLRSTQGRDKGAPSAAQTPDFKAFAC